MNEIKVVRAYCRGCNRTFEVKSETTAAFVEQEHGEREWHHPKESCDVVERGIAK